MRRGGVGSKGRSARSWRSNGVHRRAGIGHRRHTRHDGSTPDHARRELGVVLKERQRQSCRTHAAKLWKSPNGEAFAGPLSLQVLAVVESCAAWKKKEIPCTAFA